jgi:hypothetical protein
MVGVHAAAMKRCGRISNANQTPGKRQTNAWQFEWHCQPTSKPFFGCGLGLQTSR